MQAHELYLHLLGLKVPWRVEGVELDTANERILVRVTHGEGERFSCPECDLQLACYDHSEERRCQGSFQRQSAAYSGS
ncbi:MAG: hypothetical protein AAF662_03810 [Pseudomonadota bacterium]